VAANFADEIGAREIEGIERQTRRKREPEIRAGDEREGRKDQDAGGGIAGELLEPPPGRGGQAAKFTHREAGEIEENEWEIAIAEQKIGGFQKRERIAAADPEEAGTGFGRMGCGIKVVRIDEDDLRKLGCFFR